MPATRSASRNCCRSPPSGSTRQCDSTTAACAPWNAWCVPSRSGPPPAMAATRPAWPAERDGNGHGAHCPAAASGGVGPRPAAVFGVSGGAIAQDALDLALALLDGDVQLGSDLVDQAPVLARQEVVARTHDLLAALGDAPGAQVLHDPLQRVGRIAEFSPVAAAPGIAEVDHARGRVLEALVD